MQRFTIPRLMTAAALLAVFIIATHAPTDTDTWWHIRSGAWTLENGFIREDPFSHTMTGEPWINHSWGAQVVIYAAHAALGNVGLALYTALLATAGMGFVWAAGQGNAYARAFVTVLAAAAAVVFWSPRPQMLSFMFSTIMVWLLWPFLDGERDHLWWAIPLIAVWANFHAGFSIAFVLLAGAIAGLVAEQLFIADPPVGWRGIGKLVLVGLGGAAAVSLNPYGPRLLLVPFETVRISTLTTYIQEWNPPDFQNPQMIPFMMLIATTIGAVGASRTRLRWVHLALLAGTLYMALTAARNIAVFAVVAAPVVMAHTDDLLRERGWLSRQVQRVPAFVGTVNAVLLALLILAGLVYAAAALTPDAVAEEQAAVLPLAAVDFIADEQPPGPLFNSYNWGGYLLWALPDYPVFVDGRTDLYRDDFLSTYVRTYNALPGWESTLNEYGIQLVLVERGSRLDLALRDTGWRESHRDDLAVIYQRPPFN